MPRTTRTPAQILIATLAVVTALLGIWTSALAVEQTGEIQGTVRDEKGLPLPGATVTLTGPNLQGEKATVTDQKGEFIFRVLPPGRYSVKINAPGYSVILQDDVIVNIGRTTTLPITPTTGEITESVRVTGQAPLVDRTHTTTQDNYGQDYLEKVQIGSAGRDYLGVIQNSAGTGPGDGANVTVRGSTLGGNVYLVDGVDSTDPVTATFGTNFIYDAIQEVQFQTGGFNAEYSRATGGIINVVTKSGGNVFSGSVDGRYRNESFIEKGEHFDPDDQPIDRRIGEGTLGGPIVKDKLWFFTAGSYIRSDAAPAGSPTVFSFNGRYYLGKLTWQANANNKLILQLTGDPATIDNSDASRLVAAEATSKQTQGSRFVTTQWVSNFSSNVIFQAQAAYYKSQLDVEPQNGDFNTIGQINFLTGEQTRNAIGAQFSERFRDQANATLTWHKADFAGDHTFKFGIDLQRLKFTYNQFTPGGEYDTVAPGPGGSLVPLIYNEDHPVGELENSGLVAGYFVQDQWSFHPRWTLNAGLRFDAFTYDNDRGRRVLDAHLLQPRLGLAWDITGDGRNVLKGYGGVFADASLLALPRIANSRANAFDTFLNEEILGYLVFNQGPAECTQPGGCPYDLNGDGTIENRLFYQSGGGPGGSRFDRNGHLDATHVVEFSTSYERQLGARSAIGLTLVRRKTYDIIEDTCDPGIPGACDPESPVVSYLVRNIPSATRNYYGAELRYQMHWRKLFLASSYTWSKSRGNIEYTQSLGVDFDYPVHGIHRYGYLTDDTRHQVRLNGYVDLPWRFQLGYQYSYLSGFPFNRVRNVLPYGTLFLEPRGSDRLPDRHQLDLDVRRGFPIGKTELQLIVSVQNVFDTEVATSVQDLNGEALSYQIPRRYEVGAHFRF